MNISTNNSDSQQTDSSENFSDLDDINGLVCCSDCEPLVQSDQTMKIACRIDVHTDRYIVSQKEVTHEDVNEQKTMKRRRNKKLRKRIRRVIRTSWKWIKRGFAGYSITGVWMHGFSTNPSNINRTAFTPRWV